MWPAKKGIIKVNEDEKIATYKDGVLSINGHDAIIDNNMLIIDKTNYKKISDKPMDIKELDNGRGFVK